MTERRAETQRTQSFAQRMQRDLPLRAFANPFAPFALKLSLANPLTLSEEKNHCVY
jgi:hypothetical protein